MNLLEGTPNRAPQQIIVASLKELSNNINASVCREFGDLKEILRLLVVNFGGNSERISEGMLRSISGGNYM